jgi:hypothetical protein
MAHVRDSARSVGKSDPTDALAVARAALRAPQWHRAAAGVVIEQTTASAVAHRQSTAQRGDPSDRFGSSTVLSASARTARATQK